MRFKEGRRVEVLRRRKEACGSWFPARILSKSGSMYTVRYELYLTSKGEPVVEKVNQEDIRPCPPSPYEDENWFVGDTAEVFDLRCWRVGKVKKVLDNHYFVVRLAGSIQLKKFHISNLRVRLVWCDSRWISLGKASEEKAIHNSSKFAANTNPGINRFRFEEACASEKCTCQGYFCSCPLGGTQNRNHNRDDNSFPVDTAIKNNCNKRRCTEELAQHHPLPKRALPSKADMQSSSTPFPTVDENTECSVASCGSNDLPDYMVHDTRYTKHYSETSGSPLEDATSPLSPRVAQDRQGAVPEDEVAADVHELELHAYKSTVEVLYASGPLTWEQESLLTNLRMSLHISNEEHLLQLRNLLSA